MSKNQKITFEKLTGRTDRSVILPTHAFPMTKMRTSNGLPFYRVTIEGGTRDIQYPMIKR